jgi:nucleotide-binding universal stress UspA family protein
MPGIVVGVTGSDHARQVLEWAMREASQRRCPLEVMTIRPEQVRPATRILWAIPTYPENSLNPELLRMEVQEFVDKVAAETGLSVADLHVSVATGDPAEELASASREADLLVVGSSAAGLARLLSGSVSDHVAHLASCPVVVIPETAHRPGSKGATASRRHGE